MISIRSRTEGLDGMAKAEYRAMQKVGKKALSKAAAILAKGMRDKLNVRGGPSAPGSPPARVTGALRKAVGRDRPRRRGDVVGVSVGIGAGKAAERRALEAKAEGENVFAVGALHERGGIGAGGRRYPPRPFARAAELESEGAMVAAMTDVLQLDENDFALDLITDEE